MSQSYEIIPTHVVHMITTCRAWGINCNIAFNFEYYRKYGYKKVFTKLDL